MTLNYKKRVEGLMWITDLSVMNAEIDYAASIGADAYYMMSTVNIVSGIRNLGQHDYIADGIAHAHNLGLKFGVRIAEFNYSTGNSWPVFVTTPANQTRFLQDFEWYLSTYPGLDGIEIEESEGYLTTDTTLQNSWKTFKNQFLTTEKNIVLKYHSVTNDSFAWGFNVGNSGVSYLAGLGYDIPYIKQNNLVNYIGFQIATNDLTTYKGRVSEAQNLVSGSSIDIMTFQYVLTTSTWSAICDVSFNNSVCVNPALFDEINYMYSLGKATSIFTMARLKLYGSNWSLSVPTAGDKIKSIWASAPVPPPVVYGAPCGIVGDIDGDGNITQADVDLAESWLLSGIPLTADELLRIDVNGNGVADLGDLVLLKQYSLGQITTFPGCTSRFKCELPLNGFEVDQFGNRQVNTACDPVVVVPPAPSGGLEKMLVIVGGYLLVKEMFGGKK